MTCAARSGGTFPYAVSTTAARVQRLLLPDLTACLEDLLRTRERLAAASSADESVRTAAAPSEQEISKIRQLINRIKGDIAGLPGTSAPVSPRPSR